MSRLKKSVSSFYLYMLSVSNPARFIYKTFHYLRKNVPAVCARMISYQNKVVIRRQNTQDLELCTYEHSGQCVHPDITIWHDEMFLAVTPYPYGMEEYENPCVYFGKSLYQLKEIQANPIDRPERQEYGFHLSDPCITDAGKKLCCFYRKSERKRENSEVYNKNMILVKESYDGQHWSESYLIAESISDELLSPAVLYARDRFFMYHVNEGVIFLTVLSLDYHVIEKRTLRCKGFPSGYYIWHMSAAFKRDLCKSGEESGEAAGLFCMKPYDGRNGNILCIGKHKKILDEEEWEYEYLCRIPDEIRKEMQNIYKSSFIPGTEGILLGWYDKKDRYRLTEIMR